MSTLADKAREFSLLLCAVSKAANDELQVKTKEFEEQLVVSIFPQGTLNPAQNLLLSQADPLHNIAILSRRPQRYSDITLADLTYNSDVSSDNPSEEKRLLSPFLLEKKSRIAVTSGMQQANGVQILYRSKVATEVIFQPCTEEEARYAVSLFNIAAKNTDQLPDMFVYSKPLCTNDSDGMDDASLYFCHRVSVSKNEMIHIQTLRDTVPIKQRIQSKDTALPVLDESVSASAVYEIGPGFDDGDGPQITIELQWLSPKDLLCPPSSKARAEMEVVTTFGGCNSSVNFLFEELSDLSYFVHSKKSAVSDPNNSFSIDAFLAKYSKLVKSSFEQPSPASAFDTTVENNSVEGSHTISTRKLSDFLDFLWMSLRTIKEHSSIQKALTAVTKSIFSKEIHLYIPQSNATRLATFFRRIGADRGKSVQHLHLEAKEMLSDCNLPENVAQLGIYKVALDLRYIFITQDLLPQGELQCLTHVATMNCVDAFSVLVKHYKALELVLSVKLYCNVHGSILYPLTRSALQVFGSGVPHLSVEMSPSFKLSFPPLSQGSKSLVSYCERMHPTLWKTGRWGHESNTVAYAISSVPLLLGQCVQGVELDTTVEGGHFDVYCYELNTVSVCI
jgi:hypothetical protein